MYVKLLLILTIAPEAAYGQESNSASATFVGKVIGITFEYSKTMFDAIASALYYDVLPVLYAIMLIWMIIRVMLGFESTILKVSINILLILMVTGMFFVNDNFVTWFYVPVISAVYDFTGFILMTAGGLTPDAQSNYSLIKGIHTIDTNLEALLNLGWASWDTLDFGIAGSGFLDKAGEWMQLLCMIAVINILTLAFAINLAIGIIAANIMVIAMPFGLACLPFEQTRFIFRNIMRGFFQYALIAPFAAAAIGFTLMLITDSVEIANQVVTNELDETLIPWSTIRDIIIACVFSFFFVIKSSQFAAQIVTGSGSAFGNIFVPVAAMGAAMVKTYDQAKRLAPDRRRKALPGR